MRERDRPERSTTPVSSLEELASDLEDVAQANLDTRIKELDLSTRASNVLTHARVVFVGDLAQLTEADLLKQPHCGRTTLIEVRAKLAELNLHLGMYLPNWTTAAAQARREALDRKNRASVRRRRVDLPTTKSLEGELRGILMSVATGRDAEIVAKVLGWSGDGSRTLESVGQEYAITRERIRQIVARTTLKIGKYEFATPHLTKALALVHERSPATPAELGAQIRSSGISDKSFDLTGLESACAALGKEFGYGIANIGSVKVYAKVEELSLTSNFFRHCRRLTSSQGCANFDAVCDDISIAQEKRPNLQRLIALDGLCEWLDDEHRWLIVPAVSRNRLSTIVAKILSVCPEISLTELRRAASRSRRLAIVPPASVLGRFSERLRLATVVGDKVKAAPDLPNAIESGSAEETMISVMRDHGPALSWDRFQELCVAAGMNAITVAIYLSVSPVIARLARGIYSLVGAKVPPGIVEDIAKEVEAGRQRVEWGWSARGTLWCALHLKGGSIVSGAVSVPAFVGNIAGGQWQPRLGGKDIEGVIKSKDNFLWGLRRPLSNAGAEHGDVCVLEFDLGKRVVELMIGGEELIDMWESGAIELPSPEPMDVEEVG